MHRSKTLAYDRDSQLIDLENLIAALPPDASLDELADYEWWISYGNVSLGRNKCSLLSVGVRQRSVSH